MRRKPPPREDQAQPRKERYRGATDDAGEHAGAGRALVIRVVPTLPPRRGAQRRPIRRGLVGAGLRATHGVHRLRHHRRRRATELARASTAGELDRSAVALSTRHRGTNPVVCFLHSNYADVKARGPRPYFPVWRPSHTCNLGSCCIVDAFARPHAECVVSATVTFPMALGINQTTAANCATEEG
jgi:hypothetical protein